MQINSTRYTIVFIVVLCVACSLIVAASAVSLRDRQEMNQKLFRQKNVLLAAGLVKPGEKLSDREVMEIFDRNITTRLAVLETGFLLPEDRLDPKTYDQRRARNDPALSRAAPPNAAQVMRVPNYGTVYQVVKDGAIDQVVIPVEGVAMWGTVYGFLAVDKDGTTVRGLTFYDQKETPGLGGEIGNPKWQALWQGRKAFDENWNPKLTVIKGPAGTPADDPHRVDGLSGATITSNGVSRLMAFWLSKEGFGPYLRKLREGQG